MNRETKKLIGKTIIILGKLIITLGFIAVIVLGWRVATGPEVGAEDLWYGQQQPIEPVRVVS